MVQNVGGMDSAQQLKSGKYLDYISVDPFTATDVCGANPKDPMAWAGLAGDILDLAVPCVSGVGEAVKGVNGVRKANKAVDNATDAVKVSSKQLHRPYIRKSTRDAVESAAAKAPDGHFLDVHTRQPINGKYDLGHVSGHEFWRERDKAMSLGWSQKQFNDYMNNPKFYQIEAIDLK